MACLRCSLDFLIVGVELTFIQWETAVNSCVGRNDLEFLKYLLGKDIADVNRIIRDHDKSVMFWAPTAGK